MCFVYYDRNNLENNAAQRGEWWWRKKNVRFLAVKSVPRSREHDVTTPGGLPGGTIPV